MIINAFGMTDGASPTSWNVQRCEFRPHLNLIVGASGAGKTRLLNALFNLARLAVTDLPISGSFTEYIEFTLKEKRYRWDVKAESTGPSAPNTIAKESLKVEGEVILERDRVGTYLGGVRMPKLPGTSSALRLLREEDSLAPVHQAFSSIRRRSFHGAELDNARSLQTMPRNLTDAVKAAKSPSILYEHPLSLSSAGKLLHDHFHDTFRRAIEVFKEVFREVEDVRVADARSVGFEPVASTPILVLKEKAIADAIPITEWSSGMVKVLLLIVDVLTQPKPSTYMVDEYENSLGVNAIDFFPDFARDAGEEIQFFITSHHPLLINAIPILNWIVLGRDGPSVRALYGDRLKERYGLSHHEQYVKLLNDPFYQRGAL